MRRITFAVACSLDSFIARSDGGVDWILPSDHALFLMRGFWEKFDSVLMGRGTYEAALANGQKAGADAALATYVFSRTLDAAAGPGVRIVATDAVDFVTDLKNRDGKDICLMGGGRFARTLLDADLIDAIGLNIHPVLLGSGIPLFLDLKRQTNLELIDCTPFENGCVSVSYRLK